MEKELLVVFLCLKRKENVFNHLLHVASSKKKFNKTNAFFIVSEKKNHGNIHTLYECLT